MVMLHRIATWLLHGDEGQDLVEYALLAGLIAIASVVALTSLGPVIAGFYESLAPYFDV